MVVSTMKIREIKPEDNAAVKTIIHQCFIELDAELDGVSINDPEMNDLHAAYNKPGCAYWVIADENNKALGGGGYMALTGTNANEKIAEAQKFFLEKSVRGQGYGALILEEILNAAKADGYRELYLEVLDSMKAATKLYQKYGFEFCGRKGKTGHFSCKTFMVRVL